jgi:hypothetical protein
MHPISLTGDNKNESIVLVVFLLLKLVPSTILDFFAASIIFSVLAMWLLLQLL